MRLIAKALLALVALVALQGCKHTTASNYTPRQDGPMSSDGPSHYQKSEAQKVRDVYGAYQN